MLQANVTAALGVDLPAGATGAGWDEPELLGNASLVVGFGSPPGNAGLLAGWVAGQKAMAAFSLETLTMSRGLVVQRLYASASLHRFGNSWQREQLPRVGIVAVPGASKALHATGFALKSSLVWVLCRG